MKTIEQAFIQYSQRVLNTAGINESIPESTYKMMVESALSITIDDILRELSKKEDVNVLKAKFEEVVKNGEDLSPHVKALIDEENFFDKALNTLNSLLSRFLESLQKDGTLTEDQLKNLADYMQDPSKIEEMRKTIFAQE